MRFYIFVFYQLSITGAIHLCDLMLSHNVLPQHSLRSRFKFTLITCIIPSSVSHFFSDFVQVWYSIIILPITSHQFLVAEVEIIVTNRGGIFGWTLPVSGRIPDTYILSCPSSQAKVTSHIFFSSFLS